MEGKFNKFLQFLYKLNNIKINYYCIDEFSIRYTITKFNSNIFTEIIIKDNGIREIKYYTDEDNTEIDEEKLKEMKNIVNDIIDFYASNSNEN